MKLLTNIAALAVWFSAVAAYAQEPGTYEQWQEDPTRVFDSAEVHLADLQWLVRPLVVFADTPNDPRFVRQMELLLARMDELAERDVIVLTDTDPAAMSELRTHLRPRGFMLTLLAKDGSVAFRKPQPWDVREISRSIDKMPLREQEIRDRRVVAQ